ncbi:MAG: LacI family DNA-binding transcriptional regulator, partial [Salinivirgaceae bacterium]|nr:LacI family DNA-binding transcriptional regulator [Salinivirgaceae bacterium]
MLETFFQGGELMSKRGGITRVAELSGLSPATVSRAFNGHPYVTPAVRKKVYDTAHRAGYVPPEYAGKRIVAIILHNVGSSFPLNGYRSDLLYELARACERHSLRMEMFLNSELALLEEQFIKVAIVFQNFLRPAQVKKMPYTRFIRINK